MAETYSFPITTRSGQVAPPKAGSAPMPEDAANYADPMAGFDPTRVTLDVAMADGSTRYAGGDTLNYEFDPQREITPMAGRFFADVESNPNLSREAKLRIQSGYLAGIEEVREQRNKIESERMRSLLDRQRLEQGNMALVEMRQRQAEVARSAERQRSVADTVKGIIGSDIPPEEKRKQIAMWEIDNAAAAYSDPAIKNTLDAAKSLIPTPAEPLYSTKDMRDKLEKGVPPEVVLNGDPVEIGFYERIAAAQEKEMSDRLEDRKAAVKDYRSTIMDLAKEPPSFMTEDEASVAGVDLKNDPNALRYLTPESHQKGRILIGLLKGSAGLAEFEKLSDAEKREAIMVAQREAMLTALQKADAISDTDKDDVAVDSLLFGTKKR
jgi:hypothetical protein